MDLQSQSSARRQYDTHSATSSSNATNDRISASWIAKVHLSARTMEDAVLGTPDGTTASFALTASLAGFASNAKYVMLAGLAELTAGAISMALGGALQARCENNQRFTTEAYVSTAKATEATIRDTKEYIPTIVDGLFSQWDSSPVGLAHVSYDLSNTPIEAQTSFIVRFHHELSVPDNSHVLQSSATLGGSYLWLGMVVAGTWIRPALYASIALGAVALYVFGYAKTGVRIGWTGRENLRKTFMGAVMIVPVDAVASGGAVRVITGVHRSEHVAG